MIDLGSIVGTALEVAWNTVGSNTISASLCDGGGSNPTIEVIQVPIHFERGNSNMIFGVRKWIARASDFGGVTPVVGEWFEVGSDRFDIKEAFLDLTGKFWTFFVAPPGWVGAGFELMQREFAIPSDTWDWTHNLGYEPVVQVYDSDRNLLIASVTHIDVNSVRVTHSFNATGWIVLVTNG
jgi:hypothetical protein